MFHHILSCSQSFVGVVYFDIIKRQYVTQINIVTQSKIGGKAEWKGVFRQ